MKNSIFAIFVTLLFVCCGENEKSIKFKTSSKAISNISAKSDSSVSGTVTFREIDGIVTMNAELSGLTPGNHAIHIHAKGDCSADDGKSAGGHWNPTNENHGIWGTKPFHKGDIGNIVADSKGNGTISRQTDLWCIGCTDETKNIIGKAIIIHEGPDDFSSQPAGAAGPRIGCGEIVKSK